MTETQYGVKHPSGRYFWPNSAGQMYLPTPPNAGHSGGHWEASMATRDPAELESALRARIAARGEHERLVKRSRPTLLNWAEVPVVDVLEPWEQALLEGYASPLPEPVGPVAPDVNVGDLVRLTLGEDVRQGRVVRKHQLQACGVTFAPGSPSRWTIEVLERAESPVPPLPTEPGLYVYGGQGGSETARIYRRRSDGMWEAIFPGSRHHPGLVKERDEERMIAMTEPNELVRLVPETKP